MIKSFPKNIYFDRFNFGGDAGQQPCNLNGGSPFLHIAYSRVTGSLLTKRGQTYYKRFRWAPLEQTVYNRSSSHRVERPSPEMSTKGNSTTSLPLLAMDFSDPSNSSSHPERSYV